MAKQNEQNEKYDSIFGLFTKLFWELAGNTILFFATISIYRHKGEIFHTADIVFWVTAAAIVIARYLDIKFFNGQTIMGAPASMVHWRRYTVILLIFSALLWTAAHIANHLVINK